MNDTIAIDFGTKRTKLAYIHQARNTPEIMRIGQRDPLFVPSEFFLGEDGRRLFGDDAAEYLDSDPLAFLPIPLKRQMREQWVRAGNRAKAKPVELLTLLFSGLRNRTREIPQFRDALPDGLTLTIPAHYGPPDKRIMYEAAQNAGFAEENIYFVDEPIAAAHAWLSELGGEDENVVVLDCGGGTLDWACLQRTGDGALEMIPELPPDGDNEVGGFDIDKALFQVLLDRITDNSSLEKLQTQRCRVLDQLRTIKETYSRHRTGGRIRLDDVCIEIPPEVLDEVIRCRYVSQACEDLTSYLEKVRSRLKNDKPTVILVGGSARLPRLQQAISDQCRCNAVLWEWSDFACIRGALYCQQQKQHIRKDVTPDQLVGLTVNANKMYEITMSNPHYSSDLRTLNQPNTDWKTVVGPETIFIVTGCNLSCELLDRPVAERLRDVIDNYGKKSPKRRAIIMGDMWIDNLLCQFKGNSIIAVGGPDVNCITKQIDERGHRMSTGKNQYRCEYVDKVTRRMALWGATADDTRASVEALVREPQTLVVFLRQCGWNE